ncbi:DUF2207 domain-containing protein [Edaphobacillus lindanitolerans]|uniref:Predicted membrane protein n=1 Tax=Edaphobacillus lindanitolerans TaxID=550447 RepID=A0A1U7PK51_9BACI|nr:DUF2207 domain-containing protein [Edaphobacillus lindanitolerans]SIT70879.1 Predicted membrane protein [Edaphobacillus lindanitolerans]
MKCWFSILIAGLAVGLVLMLPVKVLAADYDIEKTVIDAQVHENGRVDVTESHTYRFSGKFNGITRLLVPKSGTALIDFIATENGDKLKSEKDGNLYKVYRDGKNETVTVDMNYTIMDALDKYEDGTEFYWPFFDDRNESDYGEMTIRVHPPAPSSRTDALGYDAMMGTEQVEPDGTARFGPVPVKAGTNGDIRVVFDAPLFPALSASGGTIRDHLEAERGRITEEAAAAEARREHAATAGNIALPAAGALLLVILLKEGLIARRKKEEARREATSGHFVVPDGTLSMPAILQFTAPSGTARPEWLSAALLDLIRKGLVVQLSDHVFERTDQTPDHPHEQILLDLLFRDFAGPDGHFDLSLLPDLTKSEKQADLYQAELAKWLGAVNDETKSSALREKRTGSAIILSLSGLVLTGLAIYIGIAGSIAHVLFAVPLIIGLFTSALLLRPLTPEGHRIRAGWEAFTEQFGKLDPGHWRDLPKDDRLRGYIYAVGAKDKHLSGEFEEFGSVEHRSSSTPALYINPYFMNNTFYGANSNAAQHASSVSSGSSSSGGGTGGGGGGSGAF